MKNKIISVDLGGTNLRVAVVSKGIIIKFKRIKTPKNKTEIINEINKLINEFYDKNINGIGLAVPGPIKNNIIFSTPNLPLNNVNLKQEVLKKFRTKVELENDANCVALAELFYGIKKKNFIILTLGTGIGGGIIIDGRLYKGLGNAGEFGSIVINNGKFFENLTALKAQKNLSKKYLGKVILMKDIIRMKNSDSKRIENEIFDYLGQGIGSLINIFDPESVVLTGGMTKISNNFISLVKSKAKKYVINKNHLDITISKLKEPGLIGASLLIDKHGKY